MNRPWQVIKYLTFDILAAAISWVVFFIYRKAIIEPQRFGIEIPIEFNHRFYMGLIFIPIFWITIYYITGFYKNIFFAVRDLSNSAKHLQLRWPV
jgi:hypothetical protein